ncbi:hypothetical protein FGG08_006557 [Glutinoglossum americanum]|uniref:Yeast cell wall synthesis Kre9/Knh1-like N-terminal domain-containing protein n=1 Tax=Glutinoglossum americanum TaxID=1670608 RepID=A0A9P8I112_9PEZI|nr:hypothetical protein FGG08_006557 [Glutinoglossum americanum]
MRFSLAAAFIASVASLAAAFTTPVGEPSGNPIAKPGLGEIVPVGKPYAITWNPTTPGTVSILLLRGPSTNVVPIATLVEGLDNAGTYMWTPSTSLEDDVTHYGLQLIVDGTGQFQYSTQFGISNPSGPSPSGTAKPSAAAVNATSTYNSTTKAHTTTHYTASTGHPSANTTSAKPTYSVTIQSTLYTTASAHASATAAATAAAPTGAAGQIIVSLGSLFLAVAAMFSLAF